MRLLHGLNSLAGLLGERGSDEAERHFRRALAISQSATGGQHPQVATQMRRLAAELARQGRLPEAETLARDALDLATRTLGPRHQAVTASHLPLVARVLDQQRRYAEADEIYRLAFTQAQRPSNTVIGEMHRDYGLMLLGRGDQAGAERELLAVARTARESVPRRRPSERPGDETRADGSVPPDGQAGGGRALSSAARPLRPALSARRPSSPW